MVDRVESAVFFDMTANDFYGSGKIPARDDVLCTIRYQWLSGESGYENSNALLDKKSIFP